MKRSCGIALSLAASLGAFASLAIAEHVGWPDLARPRPTGGGEKDAAVIAAVERYVFVAPVPGARANGEAWFEFLTEGKKVPVDAVILLRDQKVTAESLRKSVREAASRVGAGGTLWFVFVGHGAAAKDGKDGVLVGADAQQEVDSLYARSVSQAEMLGVLEKSVAGRVVAVVDACFSGRTPGGKPLVEGLQPLVVVREDPAPREKSIVLAAAKSDEFAGPLPGLHRPALSYLALGALRGWADADGDGRVSAKEVTTYAAKVLRAMVKGRTQTPTVAGAADAVLSEGTEKGPSLAKLVLRYGAGANEVPAPASRAPEVAALARLVGTFVDEGRAFAGALGPTSAELKTRGRSTCVFRENGVRCHYGSTYGSGPRAFVLVGTGDIRWDAALGAYRTSSRNNLGSLEGTGARNGNRLGLETTVPGQPVKLRFTYDWSSSQEIAFRLERSWQGGPWLDMQNAVSRPIAPAQSPEIQALLPLVEGSLGRGRLVPGALGAGSTEAAGEGRRSCSFSDSGLVCHYRTTFATSPKPLEIFGTIEILAGSATGSYRIVVRNNHGSFDLLGRREGARLSWESPHEGQPLRLRGAFDWSRAGEVRYRSHVSRSGGPFVAFEESVFRPE